MLDVKFFSPKRHKDHRGFFSETWNPTLMEKHQIFITFVQDNLSFSEKAGTIRGLHFQIPPHDQAKLVRCSRGSIFDVAVDIRVGSPFYGRWIGKELSSKNGMQAFIPTGFLHGFMTLEPDTEVVYKCSDFYHPELERTVRFDDPLTKIEWPSFPGVLTISDKDRNGALFINLDSPFIYRDG
jgi:dTDP-4-dehydrorhamnose 3,5-epimerase